MIFLDNVELVLRIKRSEVRVWRKVIKYGERLDDEIEKIDKDEERGIEKEIVGKFSKGVEILEKMLRMEEKRGLKY